jgi:hypothetical protein
LNDIWRSTTSEFHRQPIASQPATLENKMPVDHQLSVTVNRPLARSAATCPSDHRALSTQETSFSAATSPSHHRPLSAHETSRSAAKPSSDHRDSTSADVSRSAAKPLAPCVYIAFRCSHCGDVRQALPQLPSGDSLACPECGRPCSFVQLGSGFTRRNLPFHEIHAPEPAAPSLPSPPTLWIGDADSA